MAEFYGENWVCIDANQAIADLDRVEGKRKDEESKLNETGRKAEWTFQKARQVAMQGYHLLTNFLEMAGFSISRATQAVISGAISIGTAMYSLAAAEAVTPWMQVSAALTVIGAIAAMATATSAEQESTKISRDLEQAMRGINSLVGAFR